MFLVTSPQTAFEYWWWMSRHVNYCMVRFVYTLHVFRQWNLSCLICFRPKSALSFQILPRSFSRFCLYVDAILRQVSLQKRFIFPSCFYKHSSILFFFLILQLSTGKGGGGSGKFDRKGLEKKFYLRKFLNRFNSTHRWILNVPYRCRLRLTSADVKHKPRPVLSRSLSDVCSVDKLL